MHFGRSAYFIRLFGCPVHCPWCDSAGTWHPNYVPKDVRKVEVSELAAQAQRSGAEFVVVTGGEPAIHDLQPLTDALKAEALPAHLETSGGFSIRGEFAWITLSPKWQKLPLAENLANASELKLIIEEENSVARWLDYLGQLSPERPIWLHPEWSRRKDSRVLAAITRCVKEKGRPLRAGYQFHKLYHADELDPNARPPAPLGGDAAKGY